MYAPSTWHFLLICARPDKCPPHGGCGRISVEFMLLSFWRGSAQPLQLFSLAPPKPRTSSTSPSKSTFRCFVYSARQQFFTQIGAQSVLDSYSGHQPITLAIMSLAKKLAITDVDLKDKRVLIRVRGMLCPCHTRCECRD